MSIDRDQGLEALQRGDTVTAIQALERACQENPHDFQAHLYLGAAYGQAQRYNDAIPTLTRAVQIEPSNAQARYNLGIALERGGWPNEALTAYQQALTLQPGYDKAQEAIQRLQQAAPPQPTMPIPVSPLQPEATETVTPLNPGYGPPPAQEEAPVGLAGYQQVPASQAPPLPVGYRPPGQGTAPGYGGPQGTLYGGPPAAQPRPYVDNFDLNEALRDWGRILKSPTAFFTEQVGREGMKAPISLLVIYLLIDVILRAVGSVIKSFDLLVPAVKTSIGYFIVFLLLAFFGGGLIHIIGKMFGSRASYSGSVRAYVYGLAPILLMMCFMALIIPLLTPAPSPSQVGYAPSASSVRIVPAQFTPRRNAGGPAGQSPGQVFRSNRNGSNQFGAPGTGTRNFPGSQGNPLANPATAAGFLAAGLVAFVLFFIGAVWTTSTMTIGVSNIQGTSVGAAFGTVFITGFVIFVLYGIIVLAVGMTKVAAMMGSGAAR